MSSLRYLSVCSGMEAASVAWHHLGWKPVAFSEIENFPSAILKHHFTQPNYPYDVPNLGSLTEFNTWPLAAGDVDLLVGGTPCQSFSVAGKRGGLNDPRGQLMLSFLDLAAKLQPRYVLWENVPGALSSGQPKGSDFGCFVQGLVERGYGVAWRILDAQFFGVPQRRKRLFVCAYRDPVTGAGDWKAAAEILSLAEGLSGYIAKGKQTRKRPAANAEGCVGEGDGNGTGCWWDGGQVSQTLDAVLQKGQTMPDKNRFPAVLQPVVIDRAVCATGEITHCLTTSSSKGATEDGTGRGTPIVIDRAAFNQGENAKYAPHIGESEVMDKNNFQGIVVPSVIGTLDTDCGASKLSHQSMVSGRVMPTSHWDGSEVHPTLNAGEKSGTPGYSNQELFSQGGGGLVPAMMFKVRGGSPVETGEQGGTPGKGAGKGFLGSEEKAFTIATSPDQWLAQPTAFSFDSLASNSMKSSNPNSGCREVNLSKTIDTTNPSPNKNQGGIAIVHPIVSPTVTTCKGSRGGSSQEAIDEITALHLAQQAIPIQDGREMEKNQNGIGVGNPGDPAYTIDTTGAQAAAVPFRKSKRACSTTDNETWVEADASNTLNNFDLGDTRTTHAVVQGFSIREDSKNDTFHAKPVDVSLCVTALQPSPQSQHAQNFIVQSCADIAPTISSGAPFSKTGNERVEGEAFIVQASELRLRGQITEKDVCPTLTAGAKQGDTDPLAVHAISFQPGNLARRAGSDPSTETFPTLTKDSGDQSPHVAHQVYENSRRDAIRIYEGTSPTLQSFMGTGGCNVPMVQPAMAVRRLTPVECERLQGFSDNWSRISWKGKPAEECPDGPRYKCAGNSMAVPVMRWIGERILAVNSKL